LNQYARLYGLLLCIAIFESTAIKFFPWSSTDFCKRSGGFPTPFLFRLCGYSKVVQTVVSASVQILILAKSNYSTNQCSFTIIVSLTTTILVLVMTLFEIISQSSSLSITKIDSSGSSNSSSSNSSNDIELYVDVRRRISTVSTITTTTVDSSGIITTVVVPETKNPMTITTRWSSCW